MSAENQQERLRKSEQRKWFLAGLIEGEGSVCVSIKAHPTAKFGYYVDPEFFLYQNKNCKSLLEIAKDLFKSGRIYPKPGNESVLVYAIASRRTIAEKVLPFLQRYMTYSAKRDIYLKFGEIVDAMEKGEHRSAQGLFRIVEKAYEMNSHSKGKDRKRALEEIKRRILRDYTPDPQSAE